MAAPGSVRQRVREEGREARNLVAFHVALHREDNKVSRKPPRVPFNVIGMADSHSAVLETTNKPQTCSRLRSASTGRDKRSEFQARYWGLLFGNLQRAIGEIYSTVESHESLSECQEVILVLENYTRDFKSLCEWFRLKWEYDNTPPPQRPLSLAWEIRKTSPAKVQEYRRTRSSKSSPSVSGKNSPSISGKNSPCPPPLGKISPGVSFHKISPCSSTGKISPRTPIGCLSPKSKNDTVFFENKINDIEEVMINHINENDNSDIKDTVEVVSSEHANFVENNLANIENDLIAIEKGSDIVNDSRDCDKIDFQKVELGTATEFPSLPIPHKAVIVRKNSNKSLINKFENLNDADVKTNNNLSVKQRVLPKKNTPPHLKHINIVLDSLENEYLKTLSNKKQLADKPQSEIHGVEKISNEKIPDIQFIEPNNVGSVSNKEAIDNHNIEKSSEIKTIVVSETHSDKCKSDSSTSVKPAYSQAASKPKTVTSNLKNMHDSKSNGNKCSIYSSTVTKNSNISNNKTQPRIDVNRISRSKTIADIKQGPCKKIDQPANRQNGKPNISNKNTGSYPFNLTVGRGKIFDGNKSSNLTTNSVKVNKFPQNIRPNTLLLKKDEHSNKSIANNCTKQPNYSNIVKNENKPAMLDVNHLNSLDLMYSSSETIVNSRIELSHVESNESLKTLCPDNDASECDTTFAGSVEVLNIIDHNGGVDVNDGWLTVKCRRLGKNNQTKKFGSHWANRYNQPSATASLPTLNMIESPKEGLSKMKDFAKLEITVDSSIIDKDQIKPAVKKDAKIELDSQKPKKERKNQVKKSPNQQMPTTILRQKSDITGLKKKRAKENKYKLDFKDNVQSKIDSDVKFNQLSYSSKLKRSQNNFNKMHFSCEDLSMYISLEPNSVDEMENRVNVIHKYLNNASGKSKRSLHLSLESLNSDSYTSTSLDCILSKNDILTASEISIDNDFIKKDVIKKSNFSDGDNDESKDLSNENFDSDANEIERMTSQIEENERKMDLALDWQSEEDQRKLSEEEALLNLQIQELQQSSDIDLDTETDDTETDGEIICEEDEDGNEDVINYHSGNRLNSKMGSCYLPAYGDVADDELSLEARYEPILASMSWVERMDVLETLQSLVARYPGRAQQLHAKLSHSMRRRGSLQETLKRYEVKQARAEQHRATLQKEKSNKLQQLLARVEDVKAAKLQLTDEKRIRMDERMQKAKENRDQRLKDIVKRAHDEEEKLREIAFIKQLEDQFKKDDFLAQCHEQTCRLKEVRADRMRRLEEKAAKEAAVEERKKALETERMIRLDKMRESRKQRDERIGRQQLQKEKERVQLAEEKARERSERLSALQAAQAATAQELRRRIVLKQRESARRHQLSISQIKQRALELSSQRPEVNLIPTDRDTTSKQKTNRERKSSDKYHKNSNDDLILSMNNKKSDKMHKEKLISEGNESIEYVAGGKEKQKSQKKRLKKIKQRFLTKGQEYEDTYEFPATEAFSSKSKISRSINQISNIVHRQNNSQSVNGLNKNNGQMEMNKTKPLETRKGGSAHSSLSDLSKNSGSRVEGFVSIGNGNVNQLDRFLGELTRIMEKQINPSEKLVWLKMNGFSILSDILSTGINDKENFMSQKTLITAANLYRMACQECPRNCDYVMLSNKIINPIDLLIQRMQMVVSTGDPCPLATSLLRLLSTVLKYSSNAIAPRLQDLVSYFLGNGIVDLISQCFSSAKEPAACDLATCDLLESSLGFLANLTNRCAKNSQGEWTSRLCSCLRTSELCGSVRTVCCALAVGSGSSSDAETLEPFALQLSLATLALMTATAEADIATFQDGLSGGIGLQFRHMVTRLLRHACKSGNSANNYTTQAHDTLLHALLPAIGYFALNNEENQSLLTAGSSPCVVQQLAALPLRYFSCAEHARVLLPALLACCNRSEPARHLLHQEVSEQLLENFKISEDGKKSRLLSLIAAT